MKHPAVAVLAGTLSSLLASVPVSAGVYQDAEPGKGNVNVVHGGKPRAIVVVAENPTRPAHVAAKEFVHYVKKMTGAELRIVVDAVVPKLSWYPRRVLIGESSLTREYGLKNRDFEVTEYLLQTRSQDLILMGRDAEEYGIISYEENGLWPSARGNLSGVAFTPVGSLYAVHTALEKFCGTRWYLPGEIGEVCPKRDRVDFRNVNIRTRPWTNYRWSSRMAEPDPFDFFYRQDDYKPKRVSARDMNLHMLRMKIGGIPYSVNHSFYGYHKRFAKTHPEWWAGNPQVGKHLDYLHPEVIKQAAQDAIDFFDGKLNEDQRAHGAGDTFAVMPLDTSMGWIETEESRKLLDKPGPADPKAPSSGFFSGWASRYWFTVVNRVARIVAEKHPDKWITTCAYAPYTFPPEGMAIEPNVSVCVAGGVTTGFHPEDKRYYLDVAQRWSKLTRKLHVWEYHLHQAFGAFKQFPPIFPKRVAEGILHLKACGLQGFFFENSGSPGMVANPAEQMLNRYVIWKYCSDASVPIEKLLDEHYRLFYGPARGPMKQFFELIEARWADPEAYATSSRNRAWERFCPPKVIDQLKGLIGQAKALELEEPYRSRVELMHKAIYEPMEKNAHAYYERVKVPRRRMKCPVARSAPQIDGKLEEPAWKSAAETELFVGRHNITVSVRTTAKAMRDAGNLYVAFICEEPEMDKIVAAYDKFDDIRLAADSDIELFIDVGQTFKQYYHLLINTIPQIADRSVGMDDGAKGLDWHSEARFAVHKRKDGYDFEIAVPLKSLGVESIKPGEVWGVNFCRARGVGTWADRVSGIKNDPYSLWSPTFGGFNRPHEFGELVMDGE